jgi:hypothetical protein
MSWNTLSTQLYNLINDNKTTLGIQEVWDYPKLSFNGYPAVTITPSDNSSDYSSTTENLRKYAWRIRVFHETQVVGIDGALDALRPVVDATMDLIDDEMRASSRTVGVNMPTDYIFINISAVPSAWYTVENENLIYNEFTVTVGVTVDVT